MRTRRTRALMAAAVIALGIGGAACSGPPAAGTVRCYKPLASSTRGDLKIYPNGDAYVMTTRDGTCREPASSGRILVVHAPDWPAADVACATVDAVRFVALFPGYESPDMNDAWACAPNV